MDNFDREFKVRKKWIENYFQYGSVSIAARKCGIPRSTLYRWIKRFAEVGEEALKGKPKRPKRLAQQKIRERDEKKILSLREKYKWGPKRLSVYFLREEKRNISSTTIWRVLKKHKIKSVKKYRKHKDFKKYSRSIPGDRVQIDVTKIKKDCFQYTAIDGCTRLKVIRIYSKKNAQSSVHFLGEIIDSFGEVGFTFRESKVIMEPSFTIFLFKKNLLNTE